VRTVPVLLNDENGSLMTTFVDTPGQDIFYRMRNYGTTVADMIVLVVSAQDGICDQTKECIGIVESMNLPVIVCINKIDTDDVIKNPSKITDLKAMLKEYNALESAAVVCISARYGTNIEILQREILRIIRQLPLSLNTSCGSSDGLECSASGIVINVWRDRLNGTVLHIVLRSGAIRIGNNISSGGWVGVVKRIYIGEIAHESAAAGQGVKLVIGVLVESDPRPLGDSIYFMTKENALWLSEQRSMEIELEEALVNEEDVNKWRLEALRGCVVDASMYSSVRKDSANDDDDEDGDSVVANLPAVVLKTDSGEWQLNIYLTS
jgi:translation initiation factor IF-2